MPELYVNGAATTLNNSGAMGSTDLTCVVTSGAVFPATGNFRIRIGDEIMIVTARSTNTLTVTRHAEGTSAATHADASVVTHVLTAGALDAIRSDICGTGADASLPAAEKAGKLWLPNNGNRIYRDTGAAWNQWGPILPIKRPLVADFGVGWVNQDSTSITDSAAGIFFGSGPSDNSGGVHCYLKAYPATPFTVTVGIILRQSFETNKYPYVGIVLAQSGGNKLRTFYTLPIAAGAIQIGVDHWSDPDTNAGSDFNTTPFPSIAPVWLRINDPGSGSITYSYSFDGINFTIVGTADRTNYFTPDRIGIATRTNTASTMLYGGTYFSWLET